MVDEKLMPVSGLARASMLRVAGTWQSLGQVNQAIGTYLRIAQQYPDSAEAAAATERLLELAADFERQGRLHLAVGLYQKIDRACQ